MKLKLLPLVLGLVLATGAHADQAFDLIKKRDFREAYLAALGSLKSEAWMAKLNGPSGDNSRRLIGGVDYVIADSCKPHDCGDHNLVLAYSPLKSTVYVMVGDNGRTKLLGNPPATIAAALKDAYAARFKAP